MKSFDDNCKRERTHFLQQGIPLLIQKEEEKKLTETLGDKRAAKISNLMSGLTSLSPDLSLKDHRFVPLSSKKKNKTRKLLFHHKPLTLFRVTEETEGLL